MTKKKMKIVMRVFREFYARFRIFLGNGQGFLNDFKFPIILAIGLKVYFPNATIFFMTSLVVLMIMLLILLGWIDLTFIKIAQRQADISTSEYNPYFKRQRNSFNRISRKI